MGSLTPMGSVKDGRDLSNIGGYLLFLKCLLTLLIREIIRFSKMGGAYYLYLLEMQFCILVMEYLVYDSLNRNAILGRQL